jgi:hypothetical protein
MKLFRRSSSPQFFLPILCLPLLAIAFTPKAGSAYSSPAANPAPQAATMSCSSDDMRRHWCPADTRGGVDLIRQRSEAKCIFNSTWGFDDRGIWVDRGCRADFAVRPYAQPPRDERPHEEGAEFRGWGEGFQTYCASDDMNRNWCPADARFGVRLMRQRSEAPCVLNQTWGYGPRGIWVDRGCRADFRIAGNWDARASALFYCASDDMRRHGCSIDTRDGVFIVRQRSEADCIYGRTWGYDRGGIWVDRGCRADFEVIDRRNPEWRDQDDDHRGRDDRDRDDRRRDDRPPSQR